MSEALEHAINSPEDGAIALVLSIIHLAVEDIRLQIVPPRAARGGWKDSQRSAHKVEIERRCDARERRINAQRAATFMEHHSDRWFAVLAACGVRLSKRSLLRQLKQLKQRSEVKA